MPVAVVETLLAGVALGGTVTVTGRGVLSVVAIGDLPEPTGVFVAGRMIRAQITSKTPQTTITSARRPMQLALRPGWTFDGWVAGCAAYQSNGLW